MSRILEQHLKTTNYSNIDVKVKNFQKKAAAFKDTREKTTQSKSTNMKDI
jgi:hypothetical protein